MNQRTASIAAGSQFAGTEFAAQHSGAAIRVHEVLLQMGSESKTWVIYKRWVNAVGTACNALLARSVDGDGAAGASTDTSVAYAPDVPMYLSPGESIAIITTSATAAMEAQVMYGLLGEV